MALYLFANLAISGIALIVLLKASQAPARFKLYLCLIALLAWCIPWWLVPDFGTVSSLSVQFISVPKISEAFNKIDALVVPKESFFHWGLAIYVFMAAGFSYFFVELLKEYFRLKAWFVDSVVITKGKKFYNFDGILPPVRVLPNLNNACTTGVFNPVIWLGQNLVQSQYIDAILFHELTHVEQKDNGLLLVIHLLQRVFFWNPIVLLLAKLARGYIEMSCDEICSKKLPSYRSDLAELIIGRQNSGGYSVKKISISNPLFASSFLQKESFNVIRIKRLQGEYTMKKKYWLSVLTIGLVSVFAFVTPTLAEKQGSAKNPTKILLNFDNGKGSVSELEFDVLLGGDYETMLLNVAKKQNMQMLSSDPANGLAQVLKIQASSDEQFQELKALIENKMGLGRFDDEFKKAPQPDFPLDIAVSVRYNNTQEVKETLQGTNASWAGLRTDQYRLRVLPMVRGDLVHITSELVFFDGAEAAPIAPAFIARLGEEVEFNSETESDDGNAESISLRFKIARSE